MDTTPAGSAGSAAVPAPAPSVATVGSTAAASRWSGAERAAPLLITVGAVLLAETIRHERLLTTWLKDQVAIHAIADDIGAGTLDSPFPMPYTTALYHAVLRASFSLFGEGLLGPRLLAVALVVVTTALSFELGRRWFGATAGAFAATLCAWSPLFLGLPVVGIPNDPSPLLLAILAFWIGLERGGWRWFACAGAILGASLYLRFFFGPMAAALLVLLPWTVGHGGRLRAFLAGTGAAALVALPFFAVLLGSEAGREVRVFLDWSAGDENTMHTTLRSTTRPLAERALELGRSLSGVIQGTMDVGGPVPRRFPNLPSLLVSAAGVLYILAAARQARAQAERVLAAWLIAAVAVLLFVYAWPAEGEGGPAHRAPRYLVVLFPAPWLATAAFVQWLARLAGPRGAAVWGLAFVLLAGSDLAGHAAPAAIRAWREPSRILDETGPTIDRWLEEQRSRTGKVPVLLLDAPVGDAGRWSAPRFPLGRTAFREAVGVAHPNDPRLSLMARFPQMVYQAQPDVYRLQWRAPGGPVPTLLAPGRQPLPPLSPLDGGSDVTDVAWPLVIVTSSQRAEPLLAPRMGPSSQLGEAERVRRFQQLQPSIRAARTLSTSRGPAVAIHLVDLPERRHHEIDLRIGTEGQMLADPAGAWATDTTLFAPWLGYGFDHALLESAEPIGLPGLRAPLPFFLRFRTRPGPYSVEIERQTPRGEHPPPFRIDGNPSPTDEGAQIGDRVQRWLSRHEGTTDGVVTLRFEPTGDGRNPWALVRVRLRAPGP